jgi:hypothetical protein
MYLRVVRAAGGQGVKHEYIRIVEAYRENGKNKHRTVINLGRKDLLAAHLDLEKLARLLHGEAPSSSSENLRSEDIQALDALDWGPILAARSYRNHGHRYFDWRLENGVFRFFEHPVHFTREQAYEGKYVIQTEEENLSPIEAVRLYKELSEVERAISNIKDVIEMRPIFHRDPDRVSAHIFVAVLAFVLSCHRKEAQGRKA